MENYENVSGRKPILRDEPLPFRITVWDAEKFINDLLKDAVDELNSKESERCEITGESFTPEKYVHCSLRVGDLIQLGDRVGDRDETLTDRVRRLTHELVLSTSSRGDLIQEGDFYPLVMMLPVSAASEIKEPSVVDFTTDRISKAAEILFNTSTILFGGTPPNKAQIPEGELPAFYTPEVTLKSYINQTISSFLYKEEAFDVFKDIDLKKNGVISIKTDILTRLVTPRIVHAHHYLNNKLGFGMGHQLIDVSNERNIEVVIDPLKLFSMMLSSSEKMRYVNIRYILRKNPAEFAFTVITKW